jgi:transcriptional regulator GlxA family with amidase domain
MIIGIPVYQGVDLLDVTGPHEVFGWMGDDVEIRLLAETADVPIVSRDKFSFNVAHSLAEEQQLDIIWVPGGDPDALAAMMRGGAYLDFLKSQAKGAEWVCSVCEGALLLAAAGLLDGHDATTHWAFMPCLASFKTINVAAGFPRYVRSEVGDAKRLTGGGISSGLDESLELVRILKGDDAARDLQRTLQYYPEPRFPSDLVAPQTCEFAGLSQP